MDETYIKVKGKWSYLYRAIDKHGKTLDFMLSKRRDKATVKRFFRRAIEVNCIPSRVVIDKSGANFATEPASGCDQVHVLHKPRLLSDNGSSYVSGELAEWLQDKGMKHSRGAPYHPQTQGKIERWHQTLKNRILLENYFLPGDLEAQIEAFVDH